MCASRAVLVCEPHSRTTKGIISPDQETRLSQLEDEVGRLRGERERLLAKMRGIAKSSHPDLQFSDSDINDQTLPPSQVPRYMNRCFSSGPSNSGNSTGFGPGSLSSHHISALTQLQHQLPPAGPCTSQHHCQQQHPASVHRAPTASTKASSSSAGTNNNTSSALLKDPGTVVVNKSSLQGRYAEIPTSNTTPGNQHKHTYQMSQDLEDLQIKLIERKYGGSERSQRAARIIQAAYRDYSMRRNFERLKLCTQTCLIQSSRLTLMSASSAASSILDLDRLGGPGHQPLTTANENPQQSQEDDLVLERAYNDWEDSINITSSSFTTAGDGTLTSTETSRTTSSHPSSGSGNTTSTPNWLPVGDPSSVQCETALELIYSHASSESEGSSPQSTTISIPAMTLLTRPSTAEWEATGSSCRDSGVSSVSTTSSSDTLPPPVPPHANRMTTSRDSGVDAGSPCSSLSVQQPALLLRGSICSSCSTSSTSSCDTAGLRPSDSQSSITSSSTASSGGKPHHPRCPNRLTAPSPIWKRKDGSPPTGPALRQLSNLPASYHNLPRHKQTLPSMLPRCPAPPAPRQPASISYSSQNDTCQVCIPWGGLVTMDRYKFTNDMRRKRIYRIGLNLFNKKPEKGLQFMMRYKFVENCPQMSAKFLMTRKGLSRQMIGEYLGDIQSPFNQQVLHFFAKAIDLTGLEIDEAMRKFFSHFRLPGESQKIGHILEVFASHYLLCQTGSKMAGAGGRVGQLAGSPVDRSRVVDALYILAYAVVMLNTDLHNSNIKKEKKMRLDQFLKNLRGVDAGRDFDPALLSRVYQRVQQREFEPAGDHTTQVRRISDSLITSPGIPSTSGGLVQPHRRMVCFCRMQEVVDTHRRLKPGEHAREVFLFNDLLLVTKATPRKNTSKSTAAQVVVQSPTPSTSNFPSPSAATSNSGGNSSSPAVTPGTKVMYTCKHAYSLVGVYALIVETPLYPYAVELRRSMDQSILVTLCARTNSDQCRFFEDVQECILEMSEMEAMRIEEELVKQQRCTSKVVASTSVSKESSRHHSNHTQPFNHHQPPTSGQLAGAKRPPVHRKSDDSGLQIDL